MARAKTSKKDQVTKRMPHKFDPENKDLLLSAERRQSLDIHYVMSIIPVLRYHTVADIGCGPGYFSVPLGKHLFDGKVFALDIQQEMLDAAKKQLDRIHLTNVELMLTEEAKLPLEDDSIDGALVSFAIHEADNPKTMLAEAKRCLRIDGWLALLEWHKREMESGPPLEDRIDEADLRQMAEKAGFRHLTRHSLNKDQYMLVMNK
jgi:ubiquinone/menaquinone biosynthesis C-methylase UbiE